MSRPTMTPDQRENALVKLEDAARECGFPSHRDGSGTVVIERSGIRQWRVTPGPTVITVDCVVGDEIDTTVTLTFVRFAERMLIARDNDRAKTQERRRVG